jgi:hypothetical protein
MIDRIGIQRFFHGTFALLPAGIATLAVSALIAIAGCHSYHVDATVENRTGAAVKLLEVDYPSASFGKDVLAASCVEVAHSRSNTRLAMDVWRRLTGLQRPNCRREH